jgi:hypothetical protein
MKPSELLKKKGWCQGRSALDVDGNLVNPRSKKAVKFCIIGAVEACIRVGIDSWEDYDGAFDKVRRVLRVWSLAEWNDKPGRTKEEVIKVLKEAGL